MVAAAPKQSPSSADDGSSPQADVSRQALITPWITQIEADLDDADIELPVLPGVAAEVLSLTGDDAASVGRLAQLIKQDQSLASHVLRIANSPAYRGAHEIVALQQAITRLGMGRVAEIALAIALSGTAIDPGPYTAIADDAWNLGLSTGLWAKEVARLARANVEVAYLCGLLHNVGTSLALARLLANMRSAAPDPAAQAADLTDAVVLDILAATTGAAGELIAEHWALPQPVQYVIERLEEDLIDEHLDQTLAVTQCALWIARVDARSGFRESSLEDLVVHPAPEFLNLYPDDLAELVAATPQVRAAVEAMH